MAKVGVETQKSLFDFDFSPDVSASAIEKKKAVATEAAPGVLDGGVPAAVVSGPIAEAQDWVEGPKRVDFFVSSDRMGEFLRRIEKIQAQAVKLGLAQWDVVIGDKEWREIANPDHEQSFVPGYGRIKIEGSAVSIVGQAPVLAGWKFLAKIEHDDGGNLVKRMVGGDNSPAEWHSCGAGCDHCQTSRERKNTYMLSNVSTGEVKQVGSTCVSDFLGEQQRDPDKISALFERFVDLGLDFDYDPDKEVAAGRVTDIGFSPVDLMAATLKIVEEDGGYLSADKANIGSCLSTGDRLQAAFWAAKPIVVTPGVAHIDQAKQAVAWLKDQKTVDSLWLRNIAFLADREAITCKNAPLFGSGFVAWNRELQKQLRTERGAGDWIGEAGAKVATVATLERRGSYDNAYGTVAVLSFRDEEGNGMVWKTQSPPQGLMLGSTYHIAATVKAHGEYKGDKQTEVIRAKVAELELFSFGPLPGFKKMAAVASPDMADESGHTPLLKAVWGDKIDHAKILLAAGASANQLNQNEIPVLAYATSAAMAQVLIEAGARAVDVSPSDLGHMEADARAVVAAAVPSFSVDELAACSLLENVALQGKYSGLVMTVTDGVAVQRINREGDVVRHDVSRLSLPVREGEVVDIDYLDGVGVVGGLGGPDRGKGR